LAGAGRSLVPGCPAAAVALHILGISGQQKQTPQFPFTKGQQIGGAEAEISKHEFRRGE
jgi:hypothetical protein